MRGSHALSIALILTLAVLAGALSQRFVISADWTYGNRNTLTPASQRVVDALDHGPVTFTAYVYPGPQRDSARARLQRYVRSAANVTLVFADPARHPDRVRTLGIGDDGALHIHYQGRSQTVTDFDENSVTHALQRLSAAGDQWVVFIGGHGERGLSDESAGGYSELAAALDAQGLTTRTLNLAAAAAIPDNATLLVIAQPRQSLLPGEVAAIRGYVARGGALLWADDPGPGNGLAPLAHDLGIERSTATLVYPDFRALGTGHPAIAVVANYPDTPITERLTRFALFPYAGGLSARDDGSFKSAVFLRSATRSWLETGPVDGSRLTFEPAAGDRKGPIDMGVALTRSRGSYAGSQRIAVIADSDFMANGHLANYGNRPLAMALFQWLARRDAQIAVDIPTAPDASLQIAPARIRLLGGLFVVVLPLALLSLGLTRWWLRRRR